MARRGKKSGGRSAARPARQCEFRLPGGTQCGNTVAAEKWEAQGHRCPRHIGKGMVPTSAADNPFITPSAIYPDLMEESYPEVYRRTDRTPSAQRYQRSVAAISDIHTDSVALGRYNARVIVEAHNRWSNGADMTVPDESRRRYRTGARQYYDLLCDNVGSMRNVTDIHLLRMSGLSVRPRIASSGSRLTDRNTGEKLDLFRIQEFPERQHDVVCLQVARSDMDTSGSSLFVVDPLVSALAPTRHPERAVRDDPGLIHTPFGESPWVTTSEDYRMIENNGSLGWAHSERITSMREEKGRR